MHTKLMVAILLCCSLVAGSAAATTHTVTQSGLRFVPADLTIAAGDTVQWVWATGIHTVTNGTGALDPAVGSMFDEPLSSSSPTVTFVFTEPGIVPYFCRPHETLGMTATITVEGASDTPVRTPIGAMALLPNVPNPFNPQTLVRFELDEARSIHLAIYDVAGRQVRLLVAGRDLEPGSHEVNWDGRDTKGTAAPAGVYLAILESGNERTSRPIVLIK